MNRSTVYRTLDLLEHLGLLAEAFATFRVRTEVPDYGDIKEEELEGGRLLKGGDFAWAGQP